MESAGTWWSQSSSSRSSHVHPQNSCASSFPKQFTVRGSQFFLKMCPPFVSVLVSALFRWPCSISIHLSPRSVAAGVRPFFRWPCSNSIHLQHFYSFVSQVCHWWCPPFSAGHAAFLFICLPGLSLLVRPFPLAI